jgi:DNA-binding winged helix-turn-helix (wHTH) protein
VSESVLLSVIGSLLVLVQVLVGYIFSTSNADLRRNIADMRERLERDTSAVLGERIETVSRDMISLESRFEQYVKDKEKFDYDFRHGEYNNAISAINTQVWPLPRAVDEHQRRLDRLETKIFGGNS